MAAASFALLLSLIAWPAFNDDQSIKTSITAQAISHAPKLSKTLRLMSIAYLLYGIGMVPHTLFLVAYLHSALHFSYVQSGLFWSLFGLGATLGPVCVGLLADYYGYYKSLLGAFVLAFAAVLLIISQHSLFACALSTFFMGILLPAIPSLISSSILELVGINDHPHYWSHTTWYCAISQALAAYGMSFILRHADAYLYCFLTAALTFALGAIAIYLSKK